MKDTRVCAKCKQSFLKDDMIYKQYASGKGRYFCPECMNEKTKYNHFENEICRLFKIKKPGPLILSQRNNIKKNYGISDATILEAIDYCINIKNMVLNESIGIITPFLIDEMREYKAKKTIEEEKLLNSIKNTTYTIRYVPRNAEEVKEEKNLLDEIGDDF